MNKIKLLSIKKTKNNNKYKYIAKFLKTDRYGRKIEVYKHFGLFNELYYSKLRGSNAKKLILRKYQQMSLKTKNPINTALLNMLIIKGRPVSDIKSYYNKHTVASFGVSVFRRGAPPALLSSESIKIYDSIKKEQDAIDKKLTRKGYQLKITIPGKRRDDIEKQMAELLKDKALLSETPSEYYQKKLDQKEHEWNNAKPLTKQKVNIQVQMDALIKYRDAAKNIQKKAAFGALPLVMLAARAAPTLIRIGAKKVAPHAKKALMTAIRDSVNNISTSPSQSVGNFGGLGIYTPLGEQNFRDRNNRIYDQAQMVLLRPEPSYPQYDQQTDFLLKQERLAREARARAKEEAGENYGKVTAMKDGRQQLALFGSDPAAERAAAREAAEERWRRAAIEDAKERIRDNNWNREDVEEMVKLGVLAEVPPNELNELLSELKKQNQELLNELERQYKKK